MGDEKRVDRDVERLIDKIMDNIKENDECNECEDFKDDFQDYIFESVSSATKNRRIPFSPCNDCAKKQVIIEQYDRACFKEYIPPYVDTNCRDFKIALVVEKMDECTVETVFNFLILRMSIEDVLSIIDDPEWRAQAENLLLSSGYSCFIQKNFGRISKKLIIQILFDINFCYFNYHNSRTLKGQDCIDMVKYYLVVSLRDKIKESFFKIVKLIELEYEYKIAIIEGEIRYIIKCILQEILITPNSNLNIDSFNRIGSLTDVLKILDGVIVGSSTSMHGKHDERGDFRHIRDTIRKYEKVVRTTLDLLNKKIKQYESLIDKRKYIVGVTGICERPNVIPIEKSAPIVVPPKPIVVLNPPTT